MVAVAVIDDFLSAEELATAGTAWPSANWPGWVDYRPTHAKRASDAVSPLPPALAVVLARMAAYDLGRTVGLPGTPADLSLWGAGLHEMLPSGDGSAGSAGLGRHLDADTHARLGLRRAWSAVLFVHGKWDVRWGGRLVIEGCWPVDPLPGRLAVFDCRAAWHHVEAVSCPEGTSRRSLAVFGYLAEAGPGTRPRAMFAAA